MAETDAERMTLNADHARDRGHKCNNTNQAAYFTASAGYEIARALYQLVEQGERGTVITGEVLEREHPDNTRASDGGCLVCGARDWETDCKHGPQRQED